MYTVPIWTNGLPLASEAAQTRACVIVPWWEECGKLGVPAFDIDIRPGRAYDTRKLFASRLVSGKRKIVQSVFPGAPPPMLVQVLARLRRHGLSLQTTRTVPVARRGGRINCLCATPTSLCLCFYRKVAGSDEVQDGRKPSCIGCLSIMFWKKHEVDACVRIGS